MPDTLIDDYTFTPTHHQLVDIRASNGHLPGFTDAHAEAMAEQMNQRRADWKNAAFNSAISAIKAEMDDANIPHEQFTQWLQEQGYKAFLDFRTAKPTA
ncbi:hypothetical protein [Streptomyces sp. NBC_00459]|uniref:hypothetical protein n=1 Tax=Streptomyces sp. NBC_00459 TaxID=2975749 RepID=UPI002E19966A